jgi:hypothetical protein
MQRNRSAGRATRGANAHAKIPARCPPKLPCAVFQDDLFYMSRDS